MIKIENNTARIREELLKIATRSGTLRPVLKVMGQTLELSIRKRFDSQGPAPDGTPWAPLKASTIARKAERNKPTAILREEDNLRDHINSQVVGENTLLVGSPEKYAAIQFLGGDIPARVIRARRSKALRIPGIGFRKKVNWPGAHIPSRNALGVSSQDEADLLDDVGQYLLA